MVLNKTPVLSAEAIEAREGENNRRASERKRLYEERNRQAA